MSVRSRARSAEETVPSPLLLGHRGTRVIPAIPENTLAAFDRAMADGCHGFEFDVRLTADGEAVVCHDAKVEGFEIAHSQARQLRSLPRLKDVLTRYRHAFLDIELKVAGIEAIALTALQEHRPGRFVVSSFLPEVLRTLRSLDAVVPLGLICETSAQLRLWKKLSVEYVIPHRKLVRRGLISDLHQSGKKVLVWTVNSAAEMRRFGAWGVDGMISDYTRRLAETLVSPAR